MKRWIWIFAVASLLAISSGCKQNVCEPGTSRLCSCPGGGTGTQHCRDDGSGYKQCLCGQGQGDTSTDTTRGDTHSFDADDSQTVDTQTPDTYTPDTGDASDGSDDTGPTGDADTSPTDADHTPARLLVDERVSFSGVEPGGRASKRLEVQNPGDSALTIKRIQLVNGNAFTVKKAVDQGSGDDSKDDGSSGDGTAPVPSKDNPVSDLEGTSLPAGESVDLRVYFEPQDEQPEEDELVIESDAPVDPKATVALSGNFQAPCLAVSSGSKLDFGMSSTGQATTKTVTVENCRSRTTNLELSNIELTDDAGGAFELRSSTLPGNLANGGSYTLSGDERISFVVAFEPTAQKTFSGELLVESNDPARQRFRINLTGEGSSNACPTAVAEGSIVGTGGQPSTSLNTVPLETVQLDASNSSDSDGQVMRYEWSITDRPNGSTARLSPSSKVEQPKLFLDLAGKYTIDLVVYDDQGVRSCGSRASVQITAVPSEDIHVQLVWNTPADGDPTDSNGADLDLHYLNPKATKWNTAPWDIFWHNKTADWGDQNQQNDDPSLDIDDTDGAGPENLNHDNPESGKAYTVGVYYYDDNGFGPSYGTVRVYIDGQLQKEFKNKYLSATFEFWTVAIIEWPSKNIYKRGTKTQGFP